MNIAIFFYFNGKKYYTIGSITLSDLLNYFNCNSGLFVIEYNNFICHKKEWREIKIQKNDNIEIITIVGGG